MNRSCPSLFALLTCLLVAGAPLAGVAPTPKPPAVKGPKALPAPVKVTSVEGITEYRLANGLRVLMFPDPSKATMTINVTYLVGSRNENYGETGMAHLLEHMVFKGTEKYSGKDGGKKPVDILNELGASFNGTTWFDRTNYFITFPATDANLDQILDLEAERMGHSLILAKDLWDKENKRGEMTVVRNEYESGENDPFSVTMKRALAVAFDWHNYGKETIGCKSDIENVNTDHLRAFYHRYYTPDNAVLLLSGKLDEAKALAKINARFGLKENPKRVLEPTYTVEPTQDGERYVAIRRTGETPALLAGYKIPASADEHAAAVEVLSRVMGSAPSGRLFKALVEAKKAAEVFPINFGLKEPGILFFGALLAKDQDPAAAKAAMFQVMEDTTRPAITDEEVNRAKAELLKSVDLALNQSDNLGISLSTYIAQGDWRLFFLRRDRVKAVTTGQVQAAMDTYLRISNRTLAEFIPTTDPVRAEIAPTPDAAAMVKNYQGQAAVAQGEAFDVAFGAIESRTLRTTLPCGLKAAVVPKKTRGGSVSVNLTLHLGDEASLQGLATQGRFCVNMLLRGSELHSRQQFKDAFDRLKAQVNVFGGAEQATVMVTTVRENLPEVLKLMAEALRHPAFPEGEFAQLRQEEVAGIQYNRLEPQAVAFKAFTAATQPYPLGHVRYQGTFDEDLASIAALKVEDLKAFHRTFYGCAGELSVVGDMEPKATLDMVNTLLDGWKPAQAYQRIPDQVKAVTAQDQTLETPDKANAVFVAGCTFPLRDGDPDYPALLMANYLMGGGALKSRLADRIRQKEGISYGVGSYLNISPVDRAGSWTAYAIYNPGNVAKLQQAFREEMERAMKDGFTDKEIADAKLSWRQAAEVERAQDGGLAYQLADGLSHGRTLAFDAEVEKKVLAVGNDQILPALRKYVTLDQLVLIKAGAFKKAAAQ